MSTAAGVGVGPVAFSIQRKLAEALTPASLSVVNESHKHAGHSGNPSGAADAETHFRYAGAGRGQGDSAASTPLCVVPPACLPGW